MVNPHTFTDLHVNHFLARRTFWQTILTAIIRCMVSIDKESPRFPIYIIHNLWKLPYKKEPKFQVYIYANSTKHIFLRCFLLTPSRSVEPPYGWAAYMHIVEYMQQGFFHCYLFWMVFTCPWSGTMTSTSCDTCRNLDEFLVRWIYSKLPYAAVCVWQGESCRQPFPQCCVLPLCRIVDIETITLRKGHY